MPEKETRRRARADRRQGKAGSTQAGEYVREEIDHIREGKHGARSSKQAIAIGLSKARRDGVKVAAPKSASKDVRKRAARDEKAGQSGVKRKVSSVRSKASEKALKRERGTAASRRALSRQGRAAASRRTSAQRSASARRAATTRKSTSRSRS